MPNFEISQLGKILITTGITLIIVGILITAGLKFGLFKLPGDISLKGKNWKFYFPLASCIIISLILTIIMWVIKFFSNTK